MSVWDGQLFFVSLGMLELFKLCMVIPVVVRYDLESVATL